MDSAVITKEALQLPAEERAHIIDTLWESLDPAAQTAIDQSWLRESQDRLKAYRAGQLKAEDGEATLRSIESELGK